jgi:hypothetical protein
VPGDGDRFGHSVGSMVRAGDVSEMEADGVLDARQQGHERGMQALATGGGRG